MISDDEYSTIQHQITLIGALLEELDLNGFLERISHTHAAAPILDPTLYRRGADRLHAIEDLARACAKVQAAHRELKELVIEEEKRSVQQAISIHDSLKTRMNP